MGPWASPAHCAAVPGIPAPRGCLTFDESSCSRVQLDFLMQISVKKNHHFDKPPVANCVLVSGFEF